VFLLAEAGPNWAEVVTAVGTGVVALGLFLTALQLRDARKIRSAEIVRLLAKQWDQKEMRSARRLVARYENDEEMARDLKIAKDAQSDDYFRFTKHLNFWEQVGMSYSDHSRGLAVVDLMFGEAIDQAWGAWEPVIPQVWGRDTDIGRSFDALVKKIRRRRRSLRRRRNLRRVLLTPYSDKVPPGG
jgi:hypothetical protein